MWSCVLPTKWPVTNWHGQVEVNIPFDGDVEYTMNGQSFALAAGHAGLFWAAIPHPADPHRQLLADETDQYSNPPTSLWPINRELLTQVTHGGVLQSRSPMLVSEFELARWAGESRMDDPGRQQLAADEICLMLRRIGLDGWTRLLANHSNQGAASGGSKHSQFHVQQMLEGSIASHHDALDHQGAGRPRGVAPQLRHGTVSEGDADEHQAVRHRDADQPCQSPAQRYRSHHQVLN